MFTVDPNITDLQVKEKVISKLSFSMNSPQIATPELSVEEARCYVLFFRAGNTYSAYIGLYLPNSDRKFYYTYSGNPLPEEALGEAMDEATRFAEDMGFLLDELKLPDLSVDERNQWIEDQLIFGYKKKPEEKAEEKPAEKPAEKGEAKPSEQPPAAPAQPLGPGPPKEAPPLPQEPAAAMPMEAPPAPAGQPAAAAPETPVPRRAAPARPQAAAPPPSMPETAVQTPQLETEETVQAAPKAAAAKPQKPRPKKAAQTTTGTVSREYEALARLLASF